jgi:hypothetical protein
MVRVERAVLDAVTWTPGLRKACGILAAAVQQRLTTAARLRAQLANAGRIRHLHVLRSVVDDIEGGAHSLLEIDFGPLCRKAGIPPPLRQAVRTDAKGRRRYLDVDCGCFSVELDGAIHLHPLTWLDDAVRHNELVLTGARILRIPSILYRIDPDLVVDQLRRAHHRFAG